MATGKITQVIEAKVTGLDDVKSLEKELGKVDGKKAKVSVSVDSKAAQRSVDEFIADIKKLDAGNYTVALGLKDAQLQSELAAILADITKLDAQDITIDAKMEQANQISADIDKIETEIKQVNGTPIELDTGQAKQGLDEVGKSAESSKSVLANMVGNATQDLGALGGVAGSAGVAIGQMGEYMADAVAAGEGLGSVLGSFGAVALPVAALGVGIQLLSKALEDSAKVKFQSKQVEDFTEALAGLRKEAEGAAPAVGDFFQNLREQVLEASKLEGVTNFSDDVKDLVPLMDKAGISLDDYFSIVKDGQPALLTVSNAVVKNGTATKEQTQVLEAAMNAHADYQKALDKDAQVTRVAGEATEVSAQATGEFAKRMSDATTATDAQAKRTEESAKAAEAAAEATKAAAQAQEDYAAALASTDWAQADWTGAQEGMAGYSAQLFGLKDIAADAAEASANLAESVKKNGFTFDLATEKGRANEKALEDLSKTIDTKLTAAYVDADGNQQAFIDSATKLGEDTLAELAKQMGLNTDQTDDLRKSLGLTATDYEARFKLSGDAEARTKLGLLQSAIDNLPKDVQAKVTQQILAGDYQGAVATAQTYMTEHPPELPVDPTVHNPGAAVADANSYYANHPATLPVFPEISRYGIRQFSDGGVVGPDGGIAGEAGVEIATTPHGRQALLTGPTALTQQGTVVTSTNETARILAMLGNPQQPSVINNNTVNVYVPQGYRERDAVEAAYRSTIRSGRLYASL